MKLFPLLGRCFVIWRRALSKLRLRSVKFFHKVAERVHVSHVTVSPQTLSEGLLESRRLEARRETRQ
jgi:hypothetical protein